MIKGSRMDGVLGLKPVVCVFATCALVFSSNVYAQNKVVVVPLAGEDGPQFERTVFVNGNGTPGENGAALAAAIAEVSPIAFGVDPWMVKLEPGQYDITNQSITITSGVHLQGAGRTSTKIISSKDLNGVTLSVDSDSASISDLAYEIAAVTSGIRVQSSSTLTLRDIDFTGVRRGFAIADSSNVTVLGSSFRVNQASSSSDNDVFSIELNASVTVNSSQFFGSDTSDGLFIGSGSLTIINSYIEDNTSAVNSSLQETCRGIATSTGFNTTTCP